MTTKKQIKTYVWYVPLIHILFPLFYIVSYAVNTSGPQLTRAVAMTSSITAILVIQLCYSSFWALKLWNKLSQKTAWLVILFTICYPWFSLYLLTLPIESSTLAYMIIFCLTAIIWFIPLGFSLVAQKRG